MTEASPSVEGTARLVLFGLGTVGRAAAALSLQRPWAVIVGAVVRTAEQANRSLRDVVEGAPEHVVLSADPSAVLAATRPDVALIATRSPIDSILPDLERCARAGVNVVCTSEELACPAALRPEAGEHIDRLAREAGVTVVATGINPGFIFDALPVMLAGASWSVDRLHVSRTLDASVFGRSVHRSLGIDYEPEEFADLVAAGQIRGHIGFAESCRIISDAMGVAAEAFEERLEPVVADRAYPLREYTIEPGRTAGVTQWATARWRGREWLRFDLSLHVDPAAVGWETHDRITIEGSNPIDMTIRPGTQAVATTAARLVNSIPAALRAGPGLYRAAEILPNPPWLGDRLQN